MMKVRTDLSKMRIYSYNPAERQKLKREEQAKSKPTVEFTLSKEKSLAKSTADKNKAIFKVSVGNGGMSRAQKIAIAVKSQNAKRLEEERRERSVGSVDTPPLILNEPEKEFEGALDKAVLNLQQYSEKLHLDINPKKVFALLN